MTPRRYLQTFALIALLSISVVIPVLVGRRPAPTADLNAQGTDMTVAQAQSQAR
jgi:hypothetical protein